MKFELRDYQKQILHLSALKLHQGAKRLIVQAPTGAGKTVIFSQIATNYTQRNDKNVLILVHREELLKQTIDKFPNAKPFTAKMKRPEASNIYVAMTETANNRLLKDPNIFGDVGLLIVDEAHLANHFKVFEQFPNSYILGFSATPISARKKDPLKNYFDDIISVVDVPELIKQGALTQNITYSIRGNFDRSKAKIKNGDFDIGQMGFEYSKERSLVNTLEAYKQKAEHTKTVVFNVNIEHSMLMTNLFVKNGYNARHLDSNSTKEYREECLEWLANTPNAILNNVAILTTGFDETSIETIIMNRATKSLPLWIQCAGRGSRIHEGKTHFTILDMGGNAEFGDWSAPFDWDDFFHNPAKVGDGIAPTKVCPDCSLVLYLSARKCICGHVFESKIIYDAPIAELTMITEGIDVENIIATSELKGFRPYHSFFNIIQIVARQYHKMPIKPEPEAVLSLVHGKARIWCHLNNKRFNHFHKNIINEQFRELNIAL